MYLNIYYSDKQDGAERLKQAFYSTGEKNIAHGMQKAGLERSALNLMR